ncbi:MAG: ABC-2 family transporter protein [Acidobacteria bacterium]|nr:ABC-2 family transporter protein [Acidobacteriota bacterium]
MNWRGPVRALPTLFRIGFAEAVAYRAEFLIWILSTTMPLIMLALWSAVAREAPVGRFGQAEFTAYFLSTFIVRQVTGSWIAWELNFEVRQGTLSLRLLRPIHPMLTYAVENVAAVPLRAAIALPVAAIVLATVGSANLAGDPWLWALWVVALAGGWLISFLTSFSVGCLALYLESSARIMDLWLVLFFVFSGYIIPVELFPPVLRGIADWLPFRYQIGLPVELMTGAHGLREALGLMARQWFFIGLLFSIATLLWRGGRKRFAAYGG